jgi:hypothetical protein
MLVWSPAEATLLKNIFLRICWSQPQYFHFVCFRLEAHDRSFNFKKCSGACDPFEWQMNTTDGMLYKYVTALTTLLSSGEPNVQDYLRMHSSFHDSNSKNTNRIKGSHGLDGRYRFYSIFYLFWIVYRSQHIVNVMFTVYIMNTVVDLFGPSVNKILLLLPGQ